MSLALASQFRARVRHEEPMSRHTSWHVGGPAEIFFTPENRMDAAAFLRAVPADVPVFWIGLGSNLLVRDGGVRGVVVSTHGALDRLERTSQTTVYGESGVPCARIARQCIRWGLGPAEFFAGIPGTLGGALAMNAGAFGGETWSHVLEVETLDRQGRQHTRARDEYRVSYRHVEPPVGEEWFVAATLRFAKQPVAHTNEVRDLLERRRATQPIGAWSCGSVFTNPPGEHAARLIETSGLKGLAVGGASVSDKHANFIINDGTATASDIETLIHKVQETVERIHGIRLATEVRIVGEGR